MIALDTNILVYARREETAYHHQALSLLKELASGIKPWAIPWPVIYEYVRVVTHHKVFSPPSPLKSVVQDIVALSQAPSLVLIGEQAGHIAVFERTMLSSDAKGNLAHDAHIAAIAIEHGIEEILSCDKDLLRFAPLKSRNPFQ